MENDRLAVLYNDQSIAENWSLYIAFSEFLQDEFQPLRQLLFPETDHYRRFRSCVVNLVLNTDIASPERTQISKSKWKEAFGETMAERSERKWRSRKASLTGADVSLVHPRRRPTGESHYSEISMDPTLDRDGVDYEDDISEGASPPLTPEHSFHEDDADPVVPTSSSATVRSGPEAATTTPSSMSNHSKFERRLSTGSRHTTQSARYRYRLGILRTVDLSGEINETYNSRASLNFSMHSGEGGPKMYEVNVESDEPNELKATVVLETLITAADVAHNLQSWDHMVLWSNRLYYELRKAYQVKRGFDPHYRWFENQIGFLESYLLPLARRLECTGVFGEFGHSFPRIVEDNRDRWLTDGYDVAQTTISDGAELYPVDEHDTDED
jgi:3'5'-cyclic nucleotide phosphodiesterase